MLIGAGTGLFFSPNNSLMLANAPPERAGMVSGLFGTLRQSGYALGFAVTASLFTAVQNWFELQWTYASLLNLPDNMARNMSLMFEEGGMWSPETLIFILHLSVILCTGILIVSFVNSLPKLRMNLRRNGALLAGAAGISAVSMAAYALTAPGYIDPDSAAANQSERIVVAEVAPFGMASRKAVPVPPAPVQEAPDSVGTVAELPLYNVHCVACHGPEGTGVEGLGVDLVASELVVNSDSTELVVFLQEGRMPDAEGSITGRPMPSFAWMTQSDLDSLAAFLQQKASAD